MVKACTLLPFPSLNILLFPLNSAFDNGAHFAVAGKGGYALAALIDVIRGRGIVLVFRISRISIAACRSCY